MSHLSMKVAFLAIVMSASEEEVSLVSLMTNLPDTTLHKDKVLLGLHPKFILKVISELHINQSIHLPIFLLKPHASREENRFHSFNVRMSIGVQPSKKKTF